MAMWQEVPTFFGQSTPEVPPEVPFSRFWRGQDEPDTVGQGARPEESFLWIWLWVKTQETPREHQNRWYMGVHPPRPMAIYIYRPYIYIYIYVTLLCGCLSPKLNRSRGKPQFRACCFARGRLFMHGMIGENHYKDDMSH